MNHALRLTEFAKNPNFDVHPVLRSCTKCLSLKQQCKKMFLTIKEKIEAKTIDLNLSLLSPPPDSPHLGKSLKASFSNWLLKLFDERGCLSLLHTLRNKSGEEEMRAMRKLVP